MLTMATSQKIEWLAFIATLLVSSILLVLPERFFEQTNVKAVVEILLGSVNKLYVDSEVVSKGGDAAVARYAISFAVSLVSTFGFGSFLILKSLGSFQSPTQPPNWATKPNLLIMPILLGVTIYFALFDTLLPSLEASRSRGVFQTSLSVFWFPLIFSVVLNGTRRSVQLYILYRRKEIWQYFPP